MPHFALFYSYNFCVLLRFLLLYIVWMHSAYVFFYFVRSWYRLVFGWDSDATGFTWFFFHFVYPYIYDIFSLYYIEKELCYFLLFVFLFTYKNLFIVFFFVKSTVNKIWFCLFCFVFLWCILHVLTNCWISFFLA